MEDRRRFIDFTQFGAVMLVAAGFHVMPVAIEGAFAQTAGGGASSGAGAGAGSAAGGASAAGGGATSVQTTASPVEAPVTSGARSLTGSGGQNPAEAGLAQENVWDLGPNTAGGREGGDTSSSTQAEATAGQTNVDSVNAGTIATSGNPNTLSGTGASSLGGSSTIARAGSTSIAGAGRPEDFRIPKPIIGVDLVSIRSALRSGPTATPEADAMYGDIGMN